MRTMLLPDATILNRTVMKRNASLRGVGADVTGGITDTTGDTLANSTSGNDSGGFWSWLGSTLSPVVSSVAPTLIYDAAGIAKPPTTTSGSSGTAGVAKSSNTWLWVGVVGLGGVFILMQMRKRRRR